MADYDLQYQDTHIDVLLATANELKTAGYIYKGVATPSTNPGTPTERVAYLASEPGTYTNFGGIVIASGLYSLTYTNGTWTGTQMQAGSDIEVVQTTGQSASDVMSQKAVTDSLVGSAIAYDNSQSGLAAENVQGALDELKNAKNLDIITKPNDFMIQDDNNYAIVIFKNGHIFTKNFDSEEIASLVQRYNITDIHLSDFSIEDQNGYKIVVFRNGHIKTKFFDSETLTTNIDSKLAIEDYNDDKKDYYACKPKTLLFNYLFGSAISSDFVSNNNWSIANGRLVSTSAGINNHLVHNKYITIGQKYTYCKFTVHSDTVFGIGWLSSAYAQDGSLFTANASEGAINIHEAWSSAGTIPTVKYTLPYTFVDGRDYLIKIRKDGHTNYMSIIDCLTGAESETIQSVQTSTSGSNEFAGGRQMDRMQLVHLSGTSPDIEYIRCCASYKEPLIVVYGDSITEGDRVYNGQTYVDLMKKALGEERVMCSGLSGSKISNLITRMQFELPLLKPKFVMVSIGTNGGNTQALFNQAKQVIESNGAIPIVNVPPMGYSDLDTVRSYVLNLGITTARFDIATAINNDVSQGKNTALFADTYHPNSNGHIAMFNRLKSDCNILFNY